MTVSSCLCGHFEWCDVCRASADKQRPAVADFGAKLVIALPEDPRVAAAASLLDSMERWRELRLFGEGR